MSERLDEFPPVTIATISFATVEQLAAYREHLGLRFPLLADPQRTIYHRFGFGRGTFTEVWSLGTLKRYRDLIRQGRRLRVPMQDTRQLGGDVVLDGHGRLAAAFRPRSPDLRPSVDQLVAAVDRAG